LPKKRAKSAISAKSLPLMCRLAEGGRSAPRFRQAERLPRSRYRAGGRGPLTGDVVSSKLSRLLNQEDALSAPCLKHFRDYCGPVELARCGFPWEKTTKRPVASVCTNRETAYAVISVLSRPPRGARGYCGKASLVALIVRYRLRSPSHHFAKR
jgi:hypothetical protein